MQQTTTASVVGVFNNYTVAQRAVADLVASGFDRSEIDINSGDSYSSQAASGNTGLTGNTPSGESAGGGISGFFRNLFGSDDDDRRTYEEALNAGNSVVIVRTDSSRLDRAVDILERHDPIDVDRNFKATSRRSDQLTGTSRVNRDTSFDDRGEQSIPVVEEDFKVGKRSIQRGGVRVYSHIVEEPVQEQVSLREERVKVERRPVNRPATEADFRPPEQVIEVTETAEVPVIGKQARVTEEVVIGKEQSTRTETVRDKVRRTDVNVEHLNTEDDIDDRSFRTDFQTRFGSTPGASYDDYAPAYRYGYKMAGDSRYRGRSWNEIEADLRTDYGRSYPDSNWERMKDAVRHGWEKMTGRR
jgi:uncharacterized protein (TIGR02271 family)